MRLSKFYLPLNKDQKSKDQSYTQAMFALRKNFHLIQISGLYLQKLS